MEIVCQRMLDAVGSEGEELAIQVSIFQPLKDEVEGGDWSCTYEISGAGATLSHAMYGVDSMQALLLALKTVRGHLESLGRSKGWRISWLGMENLGISTE